MMTRFFREPPNPPPDPDPPSSSGQMTADDSTEAAPPPATTTPSDGPGGAAEEALIELAESTPGNAGDGENDGDWSATTSPSPSSGEVPNDGAMRRAVSDTPPADDVCPICFGTFDVACRGPCGHWYCGNCILQYWNFNATLRPCKCPMCSQRITKLTPEASLLQQHEPDVTRVLGGITSYNNLFVGGIHGLMLKLLAYFKRMFREMWNADRVHLNEFRLIAIFLGALYSWSPLNFQKIDRRIVIDWFDYSAFALSVIVYLIGQILRRRRMRNIREVAVIQEGPA